MSKSVFVSHAVKDSKIAKEIVELLEGGIGVPEDEIFCSSLEGFGIPTGKNFVSYIKEQIQKPKAVILLLTPSYFASNFCLCELGASWGFSHNIYPILVPPLSYDDVKDVLLGVQVAKIDNDIKYNELRDYLIQNIECDKKSNTKWDVKRKAYLKALKPLLKKIAIPKDISEEEFNKLTDSLEECSNELLDYEDEVSELKTYTKKLEKLKNTKEVIKIKKELKPSSIVDDFESVIQEISAYSDLLSTEVFMFILCEFYGQPYKIDYHDYGEEFAVATRYKYIHTEDEELVNWSNKDMGKLDKLLNDLKFIIEEKDEHDELEDYHEKEYEIALEVDNQSFWEEHYI